MRSISAIPAYGRDYKSSDALRKDWKEGKDFLIQDLLLGSVYFSIRDIDSLVKEGVDKINFRYKQARLVHVEKLKQ